MVLRFTPRRREPGIARCVDGIYWFHAGFTLLFGVLWWVGFGQGPLERVTAWVARLGSAAVLALPGARDRVKS